MSNNPDDTAKNAQDKRFAKQVPDPSGYRIVVAPIPVQEETEGGIIKPESLVKLENVASVIAYVMKIGPDAYKDSDRFPSGAWCKEGDFVIIKSYTGTRLNIHGHEIRIINDDSVEAVIEDPRGVERA